MPLCLNIFLLKEETSFKNPEFNKEKALAEIKKHLNNYRNKRMQDPIVSFIEYAPRKGISEEIYNEFMQIIRKQLGEDFYKEEEEYAREFFSERIPNPYEYR